jgi:hypothetical protein
MGSEASRHRWSPLSTSQRNLLVGELVPDQKRTRARQLGNQPEAIKELGQSAADPMNRISASLKV